MQLLTALLCLQLVTALAVLIGRFEIALAPQMGGWEGCREKELNAFTLLTIGTHAASSPCYCSSQSGSHFELP